MSSEVEAALTRLRALGVDVVIVGSFAKGQFNLHSDVDFLVLRPGDASAGTVYMEIASCMKSAAFDLHFSGRMAEDSLEFMLEDAGLESKALRARDFEESQA